MPRKKWFSTEDVIAKVQPHDVLYTKTNKDHKLNQLANQIWSNITKELFEEAGLTWNNLSPKLQDTKIQQVKTRWKSIKDNFRRELLEEKKESRSGSAASNRTKYSYTTELAFLRPSMDLDETQDNIPAEPVVPIVDDDAEEGLDNSTLSLLSTSDTPSDDTSNTSSVNVLSPVQPTTSTTKTTTTKVTARGRRQGGGGRSQSSFESGVLNSMAIIHKAFPHAEMRNTADFTDHRASCVFIKPLSVCGADIPVQSDNVPPCAVWIRRYPEKVAKCSFINISA
ncbi:uncharacterized protein [Hyperolius riggenbachi]|uniref:uncharacterized protein n=1 Tax=Hyperolius riggenbachi TaxID=752182 RepID=UPI0035A26817